MRLRREIFRFYAIVVPKSLCFYSVPFVLASVRICGGEFVLLPLSGPARGEGFCPCRPPPLDPPVTDLGVHALIAGAYDLGRGHVSVSSAHVYSSFA